MNPPGHLSTEALHTTTLKANVPPSLPIETVNQRRSLIG